MTVEKKSCLTEGPCLVRESASGGAKELGFLIHGEKKEDLLRKKLQRKTSATRSGYTVCIWPTELLDGKLVNVEHFETVFHNHTAVATTAPSSILTLATSSNLFPSQPSTMTCHASESVSAIYSTPSIVGPG